MIGRKAGLFLIALGGFGLGLVLIESQSRDAPGPSSPTEPTTAAAPEADAEETMPEDDAGMVDSAQADPVEPTTDRPASPNEPIADDEAAFEVTAPAATAAATTAPEVTAAQPPEPEKPTATAGALPAADVTSSSEIIDEGAGHAEFRITLSEPAERPIVIIYTTVDGSARNEEDYQSLFGTLTFEPGAVSRDIRTPLIDDDIKEDDEQFTIVLNGAPEVVTMRKRKAVTTIKDDD